MRNKLIHYFSLFGSLSTLLCCALPTLFVAIGMGATFASLTSSFPQIIWLSEHKDVLFCITGILIGASYATIIYSEKKTCPTNAAQQDACKAAKDYTKPLLWLTIFFYLMGISFSYVIPRILYGN